MYQNNTMVSKCLSWRQKFRHYVKKYGKYIMTSKSASWRQKVCHDGKKLFWYQLCFFPTNLVWPIPVIFLDNSGIIPGYLHVAFCNNRPTFNEVMVSYRASGGQTGTHTSPHLTSSHLTLRSTPSSLPQPSAPLLSTPSPFLPSSPSLPHSHYILPDYVLPKTHLSSPHLTSPLLSSSPPLPHSPTFPLPLYILKLCTT